MQKYKVLGTDGKQYGPINTDELHQWIAQGRVNASTSVQVVGGTDWKPLSTFPEFADVLAGSRTAPPPGGFTSPNTPPSGPVKTSGLAIAALVCGALGFLCLPALAGLMMGGIALVKISQSKGQLSGKGMAIGGICLSGFMLILAIPVGAGLLLPALARAKSKAQTINCVNNLKQIGLAARMYSADNKETFPPDFKNMSNELSTPKILVCPADSKHTSASTWAEFDPRANLTYEYLKPGITESNAMPNEVIFRCPIHNNIGLGDGSVLQQPWKR